MSLTTTLINTLEDQIISTENGTLCSEELQLVFLANLRGKSNSLLPVFRLPPEILEVIFIHGACDYYENNHRGRFTSCVPTWVNVSYVCSYWRNIALNSPTLWGYHFNVSQRWTEELLLRSKQAPLKMDIRLYHQHEISWWPSLLDSLLKHSEDRKSVV